MTPPPSTTGSPLHGVPIVQPPFDGPFGTQFSFRDPDGYVLTVHTRA